MLAHLSLLIQDPYFAAVVFIGVGMYRLLPVVAERIFAVGPSSGGPDFRRREREGVLFMAATAIVVGVGGMVWLGVRRLTHGLVPFGFVDTGLFFPVALGLWLWAGLEARRLPDESEDGERAYQTAWAE